jgi:hypothetical protein
MGRVLMAPCLFVCPKCGERARATRSAEVEHYCKANRGPNGRPRLTTFRLTAEPDGCKVSV